MKTLINTTLVLTLMSLSVMGGNNKGHKNQKSQEEKDSLYCIEIDGQVHIPGNDSDRNYKIELLCHNDVVDSGYVVDSESFLLKVKKNSWYTIRIVKEGYFPMIVSIDTRLPEHNTDSHSFHFDTELIRVESVTNIQDREALEFPIAIISYNRSIDTFSPIKQYSSNIRRSLFDGQQPVTEGYVKN
ncbi:MAG: hypothetical protein DI538_29815 [Azospira oryzae]|nr:MAG: hypothetical protein DI538_29815 [Azospira oryzae]